jgi:uncharacterized membrane protein YhhN
MMRFTLFYCALAAAALNWLAVAKKWRYLEYITKPGTMLLLLGWVWQHSYFRGELSWFALALFFSLLGDVFLMLPRQLFIAGLVAFLCAHTAYIRGLLATPELNLATLLIVLIVAIPAFQVYRRVAAELERPEEKRLKIPVLIYTVVIALMVISALLTMNRFWWPIIPSLLVSAGALLFFISDTWIVWDRFVSPLRWRDLRVMISYHLGQFGLILGAVLMFY